MITGHKDVFLQCTIIEPEMTIGETGRQIRSVVWTAGDYVVLEILMDMRL